MKKLLKVLSDDKGEALSQTCLILILLLIIAIPVYNYSKCILIANGVKKAFRSEMISAVTQNYYPAFDGMREGNSGAYKQNNSTCQSDLVNDDAAQNISAKLSLQQSGSELVKNDSNGVKQFGISDINVTVNNADFAANGKKLSVHGTLTLKIPVSFLNLKTDGFVPIHVDTEFEQKF